MLNRYLKFVQVFQLNRSIDQRIITPFEKALDSLKFVKWEYSNSKKVPLTEEQILSIDYKKFEKFYIKFDIIEI